MRVTQRKPGAKSKPKATSPAKPKRAPRVLVTECPTHGGLCQVCGWQGKRVPAPWLDYPPGTAYEEPSKLLGAVVTLRGDVVPSTVVSLATPTGGSLLQGNRSKRYRCQPTFIVRTPFGRSFFETPVPRSVVTERRRVREGLCPDAQVFSSVDRAAGYARHLERRAAEEKTHPFDLVGELPYPHRKGGSACCLNSSVHPDKLAKLVDAWRESGEESDFASAQAAVRRALPRDKRATMSLETAAQLGKGVVAVKNHCWGQWLTVEERAQESRKEYRARQKEAREERERLGLGRAPRRAGGGELRAEAARVKATRGLAQLGDALDALADLDSNFEVV